MTNAGGMNVKHIARWNGFEWKKVDWGTNQQINTLAIFQDTLYVGGFFETIGTNKDTSIALAKWYTNPCDYLDAHIYLNWQDSNVVSLRDTSGGLWKSNWHWDLGDGNVDSSQHPSHTYSKPGYYYIEMIVSHEECSDTAHLGITVPGDTTDTTGIATSISLQTPTLTIIPNPSHDSWQIRIQLLKRERGSLQIHNLAGQELMSREISGKENMITVDLKDYQPGIYICSYRVDGKVVVSQKGVVE